MTNPEAPTIPVWKHLQALLDAGDSERVARVLDDLGPSDVAYAVARLSSAARERLLTLLAPEGAAAVLEDLPDAQATEMIERIEPQTAAAIIGELRSDEQADLLRTLEAGHAEAILTEMAPEEAADARQLSAYDPESAGGLMITELLAYPAATRVRDVLDDMRDHAGRYADYEVQYVYVTDAAELLVGVVPLRRLVLTRSEAAIGDVMIPNPAHLEVTADLDAIDEALAHHRFLGLPVVDPSGRLVGVVRRSAFEAALAARAESDLLKRQGIVGGEELRSMPVLLRSRRRLTWLSINVLLNVIAASVIAFFEQTIAQVIALAAFLPIISDMSGCSGNQAVAVSMRELALGTVKPRESLRVWAQEISVGLINGVVLGALLALVAWTWKGNAWLGLVVGVALAANTVVSVSIGGTVPLVLRASGRDPALASGPILTTITDMCGFLFTLGLATLLLTKLV